MYRGMELLLGAGVAVAAQVSLVTVGGVTPLVILLDVRTRSGPGGGASSYESITETKH